MAVSPPGFQLIHRFQGHPAPIRQIQWSPDGKLLASLDEQGNLLVWNNETKKQVDQIPPQGEITS